MTIPRVSILLPVRNEEKLLPAALASLERQTLTQWELVAVDDGSSDATPAILAAAARRDRRIRVLTTRGRGLVNALNSGLAMCRSPLIARMDGDDVCHPRRLQAQQAFLAANPDIGLLACNFRHFPRQGLKVGMLSYEKWQNSLDTHEAVLRDLFVESPFVHPSVMFRKADVERVGGYRDMGWAEDYDLWLRLAVAGTLFARLPATLFFWRDRSGRATRTHAAYSPEAFRACKLHHLREGFLAGVTDVVLAGAGVEGRRWRGILDRAGIRVSLWVDVDLRKIGRMLHGAPVVSPEEVALGGRKMLITVGTRGARDGIRRWAGRIGLKEWGDFVCVT